MSTAERWVAGLIGASLLVIAAALVWAWPMLAFVSDGYRTGRAFYIASESMAPTLALGDRIAPRRLDGTGLRRGVVVAVNTPSSVRVLRVVGLAGDRVAMRAGLIILNGTTIPQRRLTGAMRAEQLPGEPSPHRIYDLDQSDGDDRSPVTVDPGKLFLLGDNRDRSADSRFGADVLGVGLVDASAVVGTVDVLFRRTHWRYRAYPVDAAPPAPAPVR